MNNLSDLQKKQWLEIKMVRHAKIQIGTIVSLDEMDFKEMGHVLELLFQLS